MPRRAPFIAALCCGALAGLGAADAQPDASQFIPTDPLQMAAGVFLRYWDSLHLAAFP